MADDNVIEFDPSRGTKKKRNYANREQMAKVTAARLAKQQARQDAASRSPAPPGRLAAKKPAAKTFDDRARKAAMAVLLAQLEHIDPGVSQRAAVKILEYTDGKPIQVIEQNTDQTTHIVYETAALVDADFTPGFGLDDTG